MGKRPDISDKLIHFTKGNSEEDAFNNLKSIIYSGELKGNEGQYIRGKHSCVCFTEAPLDACKDGFVNHNNFSRYSLFGLIFDKKWIYNTYNGRPVIYQSEEEYKILPEDMQWRHVRFEPNGDQWIDFTWEREWRINCKNFDGKVNFNSSVAKIVVPTVKWVDRLIDEFNWDQDMKILLYNQVMDAEIAEQYREDFPWEITIL